VTGLARRQQELLYADDQAPEEIPFDNYPLTGRLSMESPPLQASPQTFQYHLEADRQQLSELTAMKDALERDLQAFKHQVDTQCTDYDNLSSRLTEVKGGLSFVTKAVEMQHQSALRDRDLREATLQAEIAELKEALARAKEVEAPAAIPEGQEEPSIEEVKWEDERDEEVRRLRAEVGVLREQAEYCQRYHEQVIAS